MVQAQELAARALGALAGLPGVTVAVFNRDLRFLAIDGEPLRRHGHDPPSLVGRRAPEVLPAEAWRDLRSHYAGALDGEHTEHLAPSTDGRSTYRTHFGPVRDATGAVAGGLWLACDVTAEHDARAALARAEQASRTLLEASPDVVLRCSPDGRIRWCSPSSTAVVGSAPERMVGRDPLDLVHADDRRAVEAATARVLAEGGTERLEARTLHHDRRRLWLEATISPVAAADGRPELHVVLRDVTARRLAEAASTQWEVVFANAPIGMGLVDPDGRFVRTNAALQALLGEDEAGLRGRHVLELVHPEDVAAVRRHARGLITGPAPTRTVRHRVLTPAGRTTWVEVSASLLPDDGGPRAGTVIQVVDVTERRRLDEELHRLAEHDPLTGLANRRRFDEELTRALFACRRQGARAALLLLDVDEFKNVNDTLGHEVGDALIRHVARLVRERVRSHDVVARLGGDELAVLVEDAGGAEAARLGDALRALVREAPLAVGGVDLFVTLSAGVAALSAAAGDEREVVAAADAALYEAKRRGRDRTVLAGDGRDGGPAVTPGAHWSARLREALEHEELVLHAQPVVDLATGEAVAHELLVRLVAPGGALVLPRTFLPTAERLGLSAELDRWVLAEAARLLAAHPGRSLAVNVSGATVADPGAPRWVGTALAAAGADPRGLVVELREAVVAADRQAASAFAAGLRETGVGIALDGRAAGLVQLRKAARLGAGQLKAAGADLVADALGARLLAAVVGLAAEQGTEVVAARVEREDDVRRLREAGVRLAQGHLVGRPAPVAEALRRAGSPHV